MAVDGVLYGLGRNSASLVALDATTGKEIWVHEGLNGITSKGINFWQSEDGKDRRLIFSSTASFRRSTRAPASRSRRSGRTASSTCATGCRVPRARASRASRRAPAASGATSSLRRPIGRGVITPPGDIRAYDVITGKLLWQFHTVPHPGEFGYETNPEDGYKYIGGANNWGEMSIDESAGIVYIPTGSATVDFYGADRHGDEPVRELPARARRPHGQAPLALPDDSSRPVGPRQRLGAAARHGAAQRPATSTSSLTPARPASSTSSIA